MNDEYLRSQRQMANANNPNIEGEHQSPRSNRSATPPFNNQMKQSPTVKTERPFTPVSANQNMPSPMAPSSATQQTSPSVTAAPPPAAPTSTATGATTGEKRKNTSPSSGSSKKRLLSGVTLHDASKFANARDLEFFEKVKRMFKSETVYQNFLKCISIYNQEIINRKECSRSLSVLFHSQIDWSKVT